MDRTQHAKDFYQKHLNDPYSKQSDTAAFHLLGLQLDSMESKYDSNSGAVGRVTNPNDPHEWVNVDFDDDPFKAV